MGKRWKAFFASQSRLLFFGFMLIGLLSGSIAANLYSATISLEGADYQQSNYLIAVVDDLEAEKTPLLGLWLAVIPHDSQQIHWMPIYPTGLEEGEDNSLQSTDAIWLDLKDEALWLSLPLLRQNGLLWNESIVLDREGLSQISSWLGAEAKIPTALAWENEQQAFKEQVSFIQSFCNNSTKLAESGILDKGLMMLDKSRNLGSSLSNFEVIRLWDHFAVRDFLMECKHPWAN